MTTVAEATPLITAEQFAQRPDTGHPEELVRGRIVPLPPPEPRPGYVCNKPGRIFGNFVEDRRLGWVLNNGTGVITERDPDTVRGGDVVYCSYDRLPPGQLPASYAAVAPEFMVEVRSPGDRWPKVLATVAEYLEAGVMIVLVLDETRLSAHVFDAEGAHRMLGADDELTMPDLLPEFRAIVRRFFESQWTMIRDR
jgi:Uma2 family endonuclease